MTGNDSTATKGIKINNVIIGNKASEVNVEKWPKVIAATM
jgi:hypothetical protein